MNFAEQLLQHGADDAPALIEGARVTSYAALRSACGSIAAWIGSQNPPAGSRIGILAENGSFFVQAYLGIIRAGMVAVPLNVDGSVANIIQALSVAGTTALLTSRKQALRLAREQACLPCPATSEGALSSSEPIPPAADVQAATQLAALMFTSGSTGEPKGVMVTHRNLECNTRDIASYLGLTPADRALLVLPLHYCFGLSVLHSHLLTGAAVVINNQFLYPETVLQDIVRHGCTNLAGVPSTFQILLRKSRLKETVLPTLRFVQQAGGRLPSPVIEELLRAQPQAKFFTMYGQTEATARLSYLPPAQLSGKLGSIGRGLPSTRLEVLKTDGQPVRPGSDEVGEIVASGDNVCAGYWNDPEESARYFREGRLFTGDLARVDVDGFIYIVDRDRDMIKCGGNRISPKEIEDVLAAHAEVVEAAVIGVPHPWLGEAISAFVITTRNAQVSSDQLRELCRRSLPTYKVPEQIQLVATLPHNSSGKVLKPELRKLAAATPSAPTCATL